MTNEYAKFMDKINFKALSDFDLKYRKDLALIDSETIDQNVVCSYILSRSKELDLIYTAYDGDHFSLCSLMRRHVIRKGHVPANPESILGYKETVSARLVKRGVLLDDLAVLRGCDQLWVYTELSPSPQCVKSLAEGVIVELLYFLKRRSNPRVYFVSTFDLLRGQEPSMLPYEFSYEDTKAALTDDQSDEILSLANSGAKIDKELPSIIYHIYDPLDFKYSHWLRPKVYEVEGYIPLVPGLAVELHDFEGLENSMTRALIAWAKLSSLASEAWVLPSIDFDKKDSFIREVLINIWVRKAGAQTLKQKSWKEYMIPKVKFGNKWPITRKEGKISQWIKSLV